MKRLTLAICLIVTTIIISIISLVVIENVNEKMLSELDSVTKYAKENNYALLIDAVDHTISQWEKEKPLLNILIGQQSTNEITEDLNMIRFLAHNGENESIFLYIYECKTKLEKIKSTNEPSLSTIL